MEKRESVRKMVIACSLGGAFGTVVGLLVIPVLAWLGTLAGVAAGYVAYDFREALRAIPKALKKSHADLCERIEPFVRWGKKKHPFIYSAFISGYAITVYWCQPFVDDVFSDAYKSAPVVFVSFTAVALFILVLGVSFCLSIAAIAIVAASGLGLLKMQANDGDFWDCKSEWSYESHPMTYDEFLKCFVTGALLGPLFALGWLLVHAIKFLFYTFWVGLANFLAWLFMMIHCAERVCCAVYGGTSATAMIVYGILFMPNRTPWDIAFLATCGGLLGAFTGATIGRRLVSYVEPILLEEHRKVKS